MSAGAEHPCRGCSNVVQLAHGEVERILADFLAGQEAPLTDDPTYAARLAICGSCPDLRYGTTCRHCGCLVAIRAKLADKTCPAIPDKWPS